MAFVRFKKLSRCLSVVVTLALVSSLKCWVTNQANVEFTFFLWGIGNFTECIKRHDGLLVSLLAAENVINPSVQIIGYILRLNTFSHYLHKLEGILICPGWKHHMIDARSILLLAEIAPVTVNKHLRQEEKLGGQLTNISEVDKSIVV